MSNPRIAIAGVEDHARRLGDIEDQLAGQKPDDALFVRLADEAATAATPAKTPAASADYRRDLIKALVPRVLKAAAASAK